MGRISEALNHASSKESRRGGFPDQGVFGSPWAKDTEPPSATSARSPIPEVVPVRQSGPQPVPTTPRPQVAANPALPERMGLRWRDRLAIVPGVDPGFAEPFRRLAVTLIHGQRETGVKTLVVTSAVPDEGKTLTVVNLAMTLSEGYSRRVLLIDADLRRPSMSEALALSSSEGLSEWLGERTERRIAPVALSETLDAIPAGKAMADPLSALSSPRMGAFLQDVAQRYDWVLIDTPPVAAVADASLLCPLTDGALLVVRARQAPFKLVERAVDLLGRDRIAGVVFNGVEAEDTDTYGTYGYDPESAERRS